MNKDEVALQIFLALMGRPESKVSTGEQLGFNEVSVAFTLAETFMAIRDEKMKELSPTPFPPRDIGGISRKGVKSNAPR